MGLYELYQLTETIHHDVYPSIAATNPALSVKGKIILITGGGSGVGLATGIFYARAGAGHVIITGRTSASLSRANSQISAANPKTIVTSIVVDISEEPEVVALWKEIKEIGTVDVLVNSAGIGGPHLKFGEGNAALWLATQKINTFGTWLMCDTYAASLNIEGKALPGTVINITSHMAFMEFPTRSAYMTSKIGVTKLTQTLHEECPNIRAFSNHPGIIATKLSTLGGLAQDSVELAAGLNLYLASSRANFLRGRYVAANWDVDELELHKEEILGSEILKLTIIASTAPQGYSDKGYAWKN